MAAYFDRRRKQMGWFILSYLFSTLISLVSIGRLSQQEKDLDIPLLRHQLAILERKLDQPVKPNRAEKLTLAVVTARLRLVTHRPASGLRDVIRIIQPETVLKWDRELVRRKWLQKRKQKGGRPRISQELEDLIIQMAQENSRWGYGKIEGELSKLGFEVSESRVQDVLKRHHITPAPVRGSSSWRHLMTHYQEQLIACDFFTVETPTLKTLYVLFFIELGSRKVHRAGVTANPNQTWVTQQARQVMWELRERNPPCRFLIRERDKKFPQRTGTVRAFDTVFRSEGIGVIRTPVRAPNAYAERWVRTVREECLDHLLILNQTHLRRVLKTDTEYFNDARPHQGIGQRIPAPPQQSPSSGAVEHRKVLSGIINDYYRSSGATAVHLH
jgi:putative transposase